MRGVINIDNNTYPFGNCNNIWNKVLYYLNKKYGDELNEEDIKKLALEAKKNI